MRRTSVTVLWQIIQYKPCDLLINREIDKSKIVYHDQRNTVRSSFFKMAPAQSKPSADEAKTFVVKVDMDGDRLGGIQTTTIASKQLLRQMTINYKGIMNKHLKMAEVARVACAKIQVALSGEVEPCMATPIVGRGPGRDTVYRPFYKGNGDDLKPAMFVYCGGVHTCSKKVNDEALSQVVEYFGVHIPEYNAKYPEGTHVPAEVRASKKVKMSPGVGSPDAAGAISVGSTEDGGSGVEPISDAMKVYLWDSMMKFSPKEK